MTERVQVESFGTVIGAEVKGVDFANPSAQDFAAVRSALDAHGVVVLRVPGMQPPQHVRLAEGLAPLQPLFYGQFTLPGTPALTIVSNIRENGQHIGLADAGMLWHTDGSYNRCPDFYSLLHGLEIPQQDGQPIGDTAFTSAVHAFQALPADMRARLTQLTCTHSFEFHIEKKRSKGQLKRPPLTAQQKADLPDVVQPVVRRHPNTGLPCLFVSEGHTSKINGLAQQESDELLEFLWAHLRQPRFQYRHKWRSGDLVIWDNIAVQHLAIFDYGDQPRRMHRIGTLGPVPVPWAEQLAQATT